VAWSIACSTNWRFWRRAVAALVAGLVSTSEKLTGWVVL
jgi:hypothetical protein